MKIKSRFVLKKGAFYRTSKSVISVQKGMILSPRICEKKKEVFTKLGMKHGIRFGQFYQSCGIDARVFAPQQGMLADLIV